MYFSSSLDVGGPQVKLEDFTLTCLGTICKNEFTSIVYDSVR